MTEITDHVDHLLNGGGVAALSCAWTDIADWTTLEFVGLGVPWDGEVVHGDPATGQFSVAYGVEGRTIGLLTAGGAMDLEAAQGQVAAGVTIDVALK